MIAAKEPTRGIARTGQKLVLPPRNKILAELLGQTQKGCHNVPDAIMYPCPAIIEIPVTKRLLSFTSETKFRHIKVLASRKTPTRTIIQVCNETQIVLLCFFFNFEHNLQCSLIFFFLRPFLKKRPSPVRLDMNDTRVHNS